MSNFKKKKEQSFVAEKRIQMPLRLDTEAAQPLKKQLSKQKNLKKPTQVERAQKTYKIERYVTYGAANESASTVFKAPKTTLSIKQLVRTMNELKSYLESEYDELLSGKIAQNRYKQINQMLNSNYFRYRNTTFMNALNQFSNVIQALELLMSKLTNNQKLTEKVFIRDEEEFVLFFKFFFAKPYNLINLPAVRKVVKLLWDQSLFPSLTIQAILNNLRLWIFGISSPLNPSMNKLHKICTQFSDQISKVVTHKSNMYVYVGVNDSDTLCLTPLMVALIAGNIKGVQKLIKNGADKNICPITVNSKIVSESIQSFRPSGKFVIKKQFGFKERKQADPIEYLKYNNRNDQIAQILCWQNFYQLKKLRKNNQIIDLLQVFPNCCFQIDWKQFRRIICFKDLPQDIISVYKRDNCIRIDYHVNSLQLSKKKGHFSLIFKALGKQDNKFFLIDHNEKTIRNILQDKDIKSIKQKFNIMMKHGNVYQVDISELKAIYMAKQNKLTMCIENYYQNYTKAPHFPTFQTQNDYFKTVVQSEIINYSQLQKNEIKAIINQKIVKLDKQKTKIIKSQSNLDVQWVQQQLNLNHLTLLLKLILVVVPQSVFFHKIKTIMRLFQDPVLRKLKLINKLPVRCKLISGQQASIQCQIKNLRYCKLQESIFKQQIRAKQMNFEQVDQPVDLSHLQDTVYLQQMYSIRASRFVGNSQKMLEIEDQEANKKFEELLQLQGIWSNDQDEDK